MIGYNKFMRKNRRKLLELFGLSFLSVILLPYNFLYSVAKKIINPNLTKEQKKSCLRSLQKNPSLAL